MIEIFIKEYQKKFFNQFSNDFSGKIKKFKKALSDPSLNPSNDLIKNLKEISTKLNEPLTIAVIGQFSSGKSSFLNALLGLNLPTGIVPVTAKPTKICYAPASMLGVIYNDGAMKMTDLQNLSTFVDQRKSLIDVKELIIYTPNKILQNISFIDTPGFNSRSDDDTKETQKILKNANGIIWISLIENAARKSELDELNLIPKELKNNSICLLSQRDKLNENDAKHTLEHAKTTYDNFFKKIVAISSKEYQDGKDGGFNEIFDFIKTINNESLKLRAKNIKKDVLNGYEILEKIILNMSEILQNFLPNFKEKNNEILEKNNKIFELFYAKIKEISDEISGEIMKNLSEQSGFYYKKNNKFLNKNYEKIEYKKPYINADNALSNLIYQNDFFAKKFKKIKKDLENTKNSILFDLDLNLQTLKNEILLYKGKFESIRKLNKNQSDIEFAQIRTYASESLSKFFDDFDKSRQNFVKDLELFVEEILIKIVTNYENAIKLTIYFIDDKIKRSCENYEESPEVFPLFYPKKSEINDRILTALNYYEFENFLIGNRTFLHKNFANLNDEFEKILNEKLKILELKILDLQRKKEIVDNIEI